jgi:polyadenylate-binding protein
VKNLDKDILANKLHEAFQECGQIKSLKVSLNADHVSNGYGFILFETEEEAQKSIDLMNGKKVGDKEVVVERFMKRGDRTAGEVRFNNLYVKDFPIENFTEKDLSDLFSQYGDILSAKIMTDEAGKSKGFGFVCFKDFDDAKKALTAMANHHQMFVTRALKKTEREAIINKRTELYKNSLQKFNLYVKNIGEETKEEDIKEFFSQYGEIRNVRIMMGDASDGSGSKVSLGYGFVCFVRQEDAAKAKQEASKQNFQGRHL